MKLKDVSVFDNAVILFVVNNKLCYEPAYRSSLCFQFDGCLIDEEVGIDGTAAFWVEDDNFYPIIRDGLGNLTTVLDEFELEEYENIGLVTEDDLCNMAKLRDVINKDYLVKRYDGRSWHE